jgi:hypothetical protein
MLTLPRYISRGEIDVFVASKLEGKIIGLIYSGSRTVELAERHSDLDVIAVTENKTDYKTFKYNGLKVNIRFVTQQDFEQEINGSGLESMCRNYFVHNKIIPVLGSEYFEDMQKIALKTTAKRVAEVCSRMLKSKGYSGQFKIPLDRIVDLNLVLNSIIRPDMLDRLLRIYTRNLQSATSEKGYAVFYTDSDLLLSSEMKEKRYSVAKHYIEKAKELLSGRKITPLQAVKSLWNCLLYNPMGSLYRDFQHQIAGRIKNSYYLENGIPVFYGLTVRDVAESMPRHLWYVHQTRNFLKKFS